jgi:hypothetical protein
MKIFSSDWWDRRMAETWPAYAFLGGLFLFGCCVGGAGVGALAWLLGR